MRYNTSNYEMHRFFCVCCGQEGIPLMRKSGFKHKDFHRKKLYCPYCKTETNHVECKTEEDVADFQYNFAEGVFLEETQKEMELIKVV